MSDFESENLRIATHNFSNLKHIFYFLRLPSNFVHEHPELVENVQNTIAQIHPFQSDFLYQIQTVILQLSQSSVLNPYTVFLTEGIYPEFYEMLDTVSTFPFLIRAGVMLTLLNHVNRILWIELCEILSEDEQSFLQMHCPELVHISYDSTSL